MTTLAQQGNSIQNTKTKKLFTKLPHHTDMAISLSIIFLAVFGLVMIASSSMGLTDGNLGSLLFILVKQAAFLLGGYFMMTFFATEFKISWLRDQRFPYWALGVGAALLACLLFEGSGGARAWIRIPISSMDLSVQPSEFAKVMSIAIVAAYCGDQKVKEGKEKTTWDFVKRPVIFIGVYTFIILVLQSDLGSAAVLVCIAMACFLIPSNPAMRKLQRWIRVLLVLGVLGFGLLLSPVGESFINLLPLKTYQKNRFLSCINPFIDQYETGYQLILGLISFASGGWSGLGFGNSVRKYTNFPACNTDFILAIIVEELGMIGFLCVFIPYMIIIIRLFYYAMKIKSEKGQIILVGTAVYLLVHCLFNIGGVTGMIPLTGVPLLMISSGGSSTMAFMMAVGLSLAVIRQYKEGSLR